jgi:hypothetical protein
MSHRPARFLIDIQTVDDAGTIRVSWYNLFNATFSAASNSGVLAGGVGNLKIVATATSTQASCNYRLAGAVLRVK